MKVERWEKETDEEWAERLAEEIAIANNTEISKYFVERDPYDEEGVIINYIVEKSWTWKEHPEGPFKANQIIGWRNKAIKWDKINEVMRKTIAEIRVQKGPANIAQIVIHHTLTAYLQAMGEEVQSLDTSARKER